MFTFILPETTILLIVASEIFPARIPADTALLVLNVFKALMVIEVLSKETLSNLAEEPISPNNPIFIFSFKLDILLVIVRL